MTDALREAAAAMLAAYDDMAKCSDCEGHDHFNATDAEVLRAALANPATTRNKNLNGEINDIT